MKKFYFLISLIGLSLVTFGQTYFTEDFSDGAMPPEGWTIENQETQWSVQASGNAGGVAPEARLLWVNLIDVTRLISPEIDLSGSSDVSINFKHFLDDYSGSGYTIGLATRSGGGDWNVVWEESPTGDIGPESNYVAIDPLNAGATDFQFCFFVDGNLYNFDYWFLDDISVLTPLDLDLALTSIVLPSYVGMGSELDLTGMVSNLGITEVTSFDVSYTVDGGTPVTSSFTGVNIPMGGAYNFTHDVPIVLTEDGSYEIVAMIENINGGDDDNADNNSQMGYVGVVPFVPEKKVFGEEATGTWCGFCVRGTCYMDYMAETYPETWIGVAVHNGDPMVNAAYDGAIGDIIPNFPGYPSGTVDRFGDNYLDPTEFEEAYLERMQAISPATIDIFSFTWDAETREVTFNLESEFVVDVNNELRFAAVLIEDSLWGTSSDWAQANYYSGGGYGEMCGYEDMPATIPAAEMHYDHVAREILGTPYGQEGSLPESILAGETHSYEFTYTLPEEWIYENMHFAGILIDYTTGEVLNCNNVLNYTTSIDPIESVNQLKVYPNPANDRVNIESDSKIENLKVYSHTGQVVYETKAGSNTINVNTAQLKAGLYIIKVQTAKGISTETLIVE